MIVEVTYETSPTATALQWLSPEQTAGKEKPYLFSQCQVNIIYDDELIEVRLFFWCFALCG